MLIVKSKFSPNAYLNPWDKGEWAYVIEDRVDVRKTSAFVERNNGYEIYDAYFWIAKNYSAIFVESKTIDYHSGTTLIKVLPDGSRDGFYEKINPYRQYVLNGKPLIKKD